MGNPNVVIYAESISIRGIDRELLIRYAQLHNLEWYERRKLFYLSGDPCKLYRVLVDLTATATLIVD